MGKVQLKRTCPFVGFLLGGLEVVVVLVVVVVVVVVVFVVVVVVALVVVDRALCF